MKPVYGEVEEPRHNFFRINRKMNYQAEFLWHFHYVFELNRVPSAGGLDFAVRAMSNLFPESSRSTCATRETG